MSMLLLLLLLLLVTVAVMAMFRYSDRDIFNIPTAGMYESINLQMNYSTNDHNLY